MANPDRGEVEIVLGDGKTYLLRFDSNAIRVLENHLGSGIAWVLQNFNKMLGIDFLAKAIHAGLAYDHGKKRLTVDRIADLVPPESFENVAMAVVRGILAWRGVDLDTYSDKEELPGDGAVPKGNPT